MDEAGRGPLCGPVCCAAVILDPQDPIPGVTDSKKLSEKKREELFGQIIQRALAYHVEFVSPQEIDEKNILWATMAGMARAVAALPALAEYCLPLVKVGGVFIAMKGASAREEAEAARRAAEKLGGELADVRAFTLPDGSARSLLVYRKVRPTPPVYPRNGGKIAKSPL